MLVATSNDPSQIVRRPGVTENDNFEDGLFLDSLLAMLALVSLKPCFFMSAASSS